MSMQSLTASASLEQSGQVDISMFIMLRNGVCGSYIF